MNKPCMIKRWSFSIQHWKEKNQILSYRTTGTKKPDAWTRSCCRRVMCPSLQTLLLNFPPCAPRLSWNGIEGQAKQCLTHLNNTTSILKCYRHFLENLSSSARISRSKVSLNVLKGQAINNRAHVWRFQTATNLTWFNLH